MPSVEQDQTREQRIKTEIIADAEDKEDRAMAWYYYLEEALNFPFNAKWTKKSRKSTTPQEKQVEVLGMAPDDECLKDMIVEVAVINGKEDDVYSAKLSEIEAIDADEDTLEALADWQYWLARGYKF
ncbi:calcium-binding protein [Calothrix sp. FACHB-1219]|uniref:calcium-binding protein n=1 Tax=unclassified Calothrix TaxID=2619626 RepID=UPI00168957EE|nr:MULTISPECIES: calcium-binding protein [unclassified Calothrix]MBD2206791.1 calcium-binding protein [Calothrix sp. FACHB-168]MBD2218609.1 calcium-binding protein [Calothrix sp. FACHB-1219]